MSLDENMPKSMSKSAMHATKSYNNPIVGAQYNELQVRDLTGHIVGKVLTIADAAMEDPIRRKAMKDLIVDALWDSNWKIIDWMKAGGKEENYPFRTYAFNPDNPRE